MWNQERPRNCSVKKPVDIMTIQEAIWGVVNLQLIIQNFSDLYTYNLRLLHTHGRLLLVDNDYWSYTYIIAFSFNGFDHSGPNTQKRPKSAYETRVYWRQLILYIIRTKVNEKKQTRKKNRKNRIVKAGQANDENEYDRCAARKLDRQD